MLAATGRAAEAQTGWLGSEARDNKPGSQLSEMHNHVQSLLRVPRSVP